MKLVLQILLLLTPLFCILMLFRRNWVSKNRMKILLEDGDAAERMIKAGRWEEIRGNYLPRFKSMPSFGRMMWKLWIWDVNKFINLK